MARQNFRVWTSTRSPIIFWGLWGLASVLSSRIVCAQVGPDVIEASEKAVVRIEVTTIDSAGQGSGFVIEEDGLLITNSHVIANATKATAIFPDGRTAPIVGIRLCDPNRDIAIVRLAPSKYPVLSLASSHPRKGETVMALGSPIGLSFTVTRGIVSAVRSAEEMKREARLDEVAGTWVQVDAAISPGNSGGPLINDQGEVVAMSTLGSKGSIQNVNFGICAVDIRSAVDETSSKIWQPLIVGASLSKKQSRSPSSEERQMPKIPSQAIDEYVRNFEAELPKVKKELSLQLANQKLLLRDYRAGEIRPTIFPGGSANENAMTARESNNTGKNRRYVYFATLAGKGRNISNLESRIENLDKSLSAASGKRDEAFCSLLQLAGPPLNTRREESVGMLYDSIPRAIVGGNEMVVVHENVPYLLIVESTAGTYPGKKL